LYSRKHGGRQLVQVPGRYLNYGSSYRGQAPSDKARFRLPYEIESPGSQAQP
jgi:hypothetical protein